MTRESEERAESQIEKIHKIFANISVEPVILLFVFTSSVYQQVTQSLFLYQTCGVHLGYNDSVCSAMSDRIVSGYTEEEEAEVQKYVTKLIIISTIIEGFFPVFYLLFLGSWSDRNSRRKPLILAPIIGEIIAVALLILNTVWFKTWPVIFTALSASLPPAISGGWPCFFLGVYSYISSGPDDDHKTAKIALSSSVQNMSCIIGVGSSGLLLKPLGFVGVYTACLIMLLSSLVYGFWRIKDIELKVKEEDRKFEAYHSLFDFFNISNFVETLKVCFKNRACIGKGGMYVILMCSVVVSGSMRGDAAVTYMYTRFKLVWDELDFSVFIIAHSLMDLTGSFVALVIFSKILKWKDASLGIIALLSTILANLVYAFAPNTMIFYLGMILEPFYATPTTALRSIIAKVVPEHEQGQSNSVFGICEALLPLVFGPIYSMMYDYTIQIFPGAFYIISCGLYLIGVFLFIWLYRVTKMDEANVNEEG